MNMIEKARRKPCVARPGVALLATTLLAGMALAGCSSSSSPSPFDPAPETDLNVFGVRGDAELIRFSVAEPSAVESLGTVSALSAGESIVGIDFRPTGPTTGDLHAVTSTGRSLILDPETAMATEIQAITGDGTVLTGNRIGVDFNPAANALRIIGDDGKNLRVPTAALTNPAPAMAVNTLVDGVMGYRQGIIAAAYTNPDQGAAGTTLFVIDADNELYTQEPPNDGLLNPVGNLGVAGAGPADAYNIVQVGVINEHYVLLTVDQTTSLYSINPASGAATAIGDLPGSGYLALIVELDPELAAGERFVGALRQDGSNAVVEFYALDTVAGTLTADGTETFTLPSGEELVGADVRTPRPEAQAAADPVALDTGYAVSRSGVIYQLADGTAEPFATLEGPDGATLALSGTAFGVDFNPRADLLRIVSDTGQNLRVNLEEGREIAGATRAAGFAFVDGTTRLASPAAQIVATAYRAENPGGGMFQYALDARDSSLARVAVPNDGALVRVGPLGVTLPANGPAAAEQSLDIVTLSGTEIGLAALRPAGNSLSTLYTVNLETGAATAVGPIGSQGAVNAITLRLSMP